jgi:hypothetical protein
MGAVSAEAPAPVAMTRATAAALVGDVHATTGYRAGLVRLPGGRPDGPVWAVAAVQVVTRATRTLRSREDWAAFRGETTQEVRGMRTARTATATAPVAPASAPAANGGDAPDEVATVTLDFPGWRAATEAALQEVEAQAVRARERLAAQEAALVRARRATAAAIAARKREAQLLRKTLAAVATLAGAAAVRAVDGDAHRAEHPAGGKAAAVGRWTETLRDYARVHPDGFRLSACRRETGLPDGSTGYGAIRRLLDAGELEKPEPGFYRAPVPVAARPETAA